MHTLVTESTTQASPRAPALTLACAVGAGICAARLMPDCLLLWWVGALCCGLTWIGLHWLRCHRAATCSLIFGWSLLAAAWHDVRWSLIPADEVSRLTNEGGTSVRMTVKILEPAWLIERAADGSSPSWNAPERTLTTCVCRELSTSEDRFSVSGRLRLSVDGRLPQLTCGDVVQIVGKLRHPGEPLNPGDFNFKDWLQNRSIRGLLQVETVEGVQPVMRESFPSDVAGRWRHAIRQRAQNLFAEHLRGEAVGVAETMLLGGRRQFDDELRQAFIDSGMLHVLAISGVNVALLGWWLTILFRLTGASARLTIWGVLMGLVAYAAVTDADPPVVRATVMAVLAGLALRFGKNVSTLQIVSITLLGMVLISPTDLFDTGAQLSFLSVLAIGRTIAWLKPPRSLEPVESNWPVWLRTPAHLWCEAALISAGIWLATTPLVTWRFQLVSPAGLVLNILLGPLIVVLMWAGYSFLIVGLIAPVAAAPLGWMFDGCLWMLIKSVTWASTWPFSHLEIGSPPDWWMVGYYGGLGLLLLDVRRNIATRFAVRGLLVWTVIGLAAPLCSEHKGEFKCRFLAVGHGLSVLLELPDGQVVLYDAGSMGDGRRAARIVKQELLRLGHRRIDAVILSHADADHCNALPEMLSTIPISAVLIGPGFLDGNQPLPYEIVSRCAATGTEVKLLAAGHRLVLHPEVEIVVLHPSEEFYADTDNPLSLVTGIEYQGRRILLTGDVELSGLTTLLRSPAWPCDVLLSPHHGSRAANPRELAAWSRPEWVIVSTSDRAAENRVAATYEGMADVLCTARHGAVEIRIADGGKLSVDSFRSDALPID